MYELVQTLLWLLVVVLVRPGSDVMVRSGTVGEGVTAGSKYMHKFRKVYVHINKNIALCQLIGSVLFSAAHSVSP